MWCQFRTTYGQKKNTNALSEYGAYLIWTGRISKIWWKRQSRQSEREGTSYYSSQCLAGKRSRSRAFTIYQISNWEWDLPNFTICCSSNLDSKIQRNRDSLKQTVTTRRWLLGCSPTINDIMYDKILKFVKNKQYTFLSSFKIHLRTILTFAIIY